MRTLLLLGLLVASLLVPTQHTAHAATQCYGSSCNYAYPQAGGCLDDGQVVSHQDIYNNGQKIATVFLGYSLSCNANWAKVETYNFANAYVEASLWNGDGGADVKRFTQTASGCAGCGFGVLARTPMWDGAYLAWACGYIRNINQPSQSWSTCTSAV